MKVLRIIRWAFSVTLLLICLAYSETAYAQNRVSFAWSRGTLDASTHERRVRAQSGMLEIFNTYAREIKPFNDITVNVITAAECEDRGLGCREGRSIFSIYISGAYYIIWDDAFENGRNLDNAHEVLHWFNPGSRLNRESFYDVDLYDNRVWDELFTDYYSKYYFDRSGLTSTDDVYSWIRPVMPKLIEVIQLADQKPIRRTLTGGLLMPGSL